MTTTPLRIRRAGRILARGAAVLVAVTAFAAAWTTASPAGAGPAAQEPGEGRVFRVPIHGTIELGLAPFVARALEEASAEGAAAVVLDLDTPGGRVDAAWAIIDAVRDADLPVYAWVNRRALSAGAMIALSADRIYVRSGSTIGAATPVTGQGEKASEKMVSAMRSEFRALAEARGIDPRLAEAMVDESIEIPGVIEAGRLLTLTGEEAISLGIANGAADDLDALLRDAGIGAVVTVDTAPNWAERIVRFLTNPIVAPMLLSLGFLGVLIEIKTPTFGLAGAVGLAALAAFFGAHHLVRLAGMEEIILFAVGIVLLAAEVLVIPGFGIAGILGGAAILGGATLSMVGAVASFSDVLEALGLVSLSLILVGVAAWALLRHLPSSRRLAGVFLRESTSRETGYLSAPDRMDLIGKTGRAVTDLRPAGTAVIDEERVDVVTEGPWIEQGTEVRVVSAEGYRHVVRALDPGDAIEPPGGARTPDSAAAADSRDPETGADA